jgi:ATP-binding cassette subfamily F protein 3
MLLRPSNTLLLDEPTNHLDLDSKYVLLDALEDYGGTLIIVSHDRYFVEKLATKIIEIGHGQAIVYPGTYAEFLWSKEHGVETAIKSQIPSAKSQKSEASSVTTKTSKTSPAGGAVREERKREEAERRKKQRALDSLQRRINELETRITDREAQVKALEAAMSVPGFYDDRAASQSIVDQHQALMWEVGDLMAQWEALQDHATEQAPKP